MQVFTVSTWTLPFSCPHSRCTRRRSCEVAVIVPCAPAIFLWAMRVPLRVPGPSLTLSSLGDESMQAHLMCNHSIDCTIVSECPHFSLLALEWQHFDQYYGVPQPASAGGVGHITHGFLTCLLFQRPSLSSADLALLQRASSMTSYHRHHHSHNNNMFHYL